MNPDILAVILAGGASSRMGRDKRALPFGPDTMLTHLIKEYRRGFPVAVSVRTPEHLPDAGGVPELADLSPGQGPLAGLQSAFRLTEARQIFLTATDLPFGRLDLAERLAELWTPEADACVIRRRDGGIEPLFALYRRSCLAPAEACLRQGRRSFRTLLERIRVRWVAEDALSGWPLAEILDNINTPEDYQRALERLR